MLTSSLVFNLPHGNHAWNCSRIFSSRFDSRRFVSPNHAQFVPINNPRPPLSIAPKSPKKEPPGCPCLSSPSRHCRRRSSSIPSSSNLPSPSRLAFLLPMPAHIAWTSSRATKDLERTSSSSTGSRRHCDHVSCWGGHEILRRPLSFWFAKITRISLTSCSIFTAAKSSSACSTRRPPQPPYLQSSSGCL